MRTDFPKHHRRRRSEPSLWADEPIDDVLARIQTALREDRPARRDDKEHHSEVSEVCLLREENARLRQLLAQLSGPIR